MEEPREALPIPIPIRPVQDRFIVTLGDCWAVCWQCACGATLNIPTPTPICLPVACPGCGVAFDHHPKWVQLQEVRTGEVGKGS